MRTARALETLRPEPHRGDTVAAGVVALTTAIYVLELRFQDSWGVGIRLVLAALAAAFVTALAVQSPVEGERPRAYQSALYISAFALSLAAIANLADLLGSDGGSGTVVWVGSLVGAFAAWFAIRRNSAVMTLVAAVTYGIVVLTFVDWVFNPSGVSTFRWILLLLIFGYVVASLSQRGPRPRHAVQLVNAAGLATIGLAVTFVIDSIFGGLVGAGAGAGAGTGWELVLLACGFGLVAYSAVDREPGPGYLGVVVLLLFVWIGGSPGRDGASLIGWPIFLLLASGALLAAGLRPSRPLPPPPDAGAPPPPPPARMPVQPVDPPTTPLGGDDTTEIHDP
jgi:hypothetical protein